MPQASILGNYKLDTKGNSSFSAAEESVYVADPRRHRRWFGTIGNASAE
jgi:hypothetical protein